MARFPVAKNDILVLAAKVSQGIGDNPGDYPNPPFDNATIAGLLASVVTQIADRQDKEAQAKAALDLENETLGDIVEEAKRLIRLAEATHGQDAAKLQEIGWDTKADPKSKAPGQVRNLDVMSQGAGTVELDWKAPKKTAGVGTPRAYRIERQLRDLNTNTVTEEFGVWKSIHIETEAVLTDQPRQVEISYKVYAFNANGDGQPSDTEMVVL